MNTAISNSLEQVSFYLFTIQSHLDNTLLHMFWIGYLYLIEITHIYLINLKPIPFSRDTRVNTESTKISPDPQYPLSNCYEVPGSCTCKPGILGFSMIYCIFTSYHLRVYIRLGTMDITDVFQKSRCNLPVIIKGSTSITY